MRLKRRTEFVTLAGAVLEPVERPKPPPPPPKPEPEFKFVPFHQLEPEPEPSGATHVAPEPVPAAPVIVAAPEQAKAKERQGTRTDKHPGKFPQGSSGKAKDKAAAGTGWPYRWKGVRAEACEGSCGGRFFISSALRMHHASGTMLCKSCYSNPRPESR